MEFSHRSDPKKACRKNGTKELIKWRECVAKVEDPDTEEERICGMLFCNKAEINAHMRIAEAGFSVEANFALYRG